MKEKVEAPAKTKATTNNVETLRPKAKKTPKAEPQADSTTLPSIQGEENAALANAAVPVAAEVTASVEVNPDGEATAWPEPIDQIVERHYQRRRDLADADADALIKEGTYAFRPRVFINGKIVEPKRIITVPEGGNRWSGARSPELAEIGYLVPHVACHVEGREFHVYEVEIGGGKLTVLADEDSYLNFDHNNSYEPSWRARKDGTVILVNSTSVDDTFVGHTNLINVESTGTVYNNSTVRYTPAGDNDPRIEPWETRRPRVNILGPRVKVSGAQLRGSTVVDTPLEGGSYFDSSIKGTTIKAGTVGIDSCDIRDCFFNIAGSLKLDTATLETVSIHDKSGVDISNFIRKDLYLGGDGKVFITNKFDLTEIPIPTAGDVKLIREGAKTFSLLAEDHRTFPIKIGDNEYEINKAVMALLDISESNPYDLDDYTSGIVRYISRSIESRLKVIAMLNAARTSIVILNNSHKRWRSVYD